MEAQSMHRGDSRSNKPSGAGVGRGWICGHSEELGFYSLILYRAGTFSSGPSWEQEQDMRKSSEWALLVLGGLLEARRPAVLSLFLSAFLFFWPRYLGDMGTFARLVKVSCRLH